MLMNTVVACKLKLTTILLRRELQIYTRFYMYEGQMSYIDDKHQT